MVVLNKSNTRIGYVMVVLNKSNAQLGCVMVVLCPARICNHKFGMGLKPSNTCLEKTAGSFAGSFMKPCTV